MNLFITDSRSDEQRDDVYDASRWRHANPGTS